jgi:hypothetical protein
VGKRRNQEQQEDREALHHGMHDSASGIWQKRVPAPHAVAGDGYCAWGRGYLLWSTFAVLRKRGRAGGPVPRALPPRIKWSNARLQEPPRTARTRLADGTEVRRYFTYGAVHWVSHCPASEKHTDPSGQSLVLEQEGDLV